MMADKQDEQKHDRKKALSDIRSMWETMPTNVSKSRSTGNNKSKATRKSSVSSLLFRNKTAKADRVETKPSPNVLTASHATARKASLQDDGLLTSFNTSLKKDTSSYPAEFESVTQSDEVLNSISTSAAQNSQSEPNDNQTTLSANTEQQKDTSCPSDVQESTTNTIITDSQTIDMEEEVILRNDVSSRGSSGYFTGKSSESQGRPLSNKRSSKKLSRPRISIVFEPEYSDDENNNEENIGLEKVIEHEDENNSNYVQDKELEDLFGGILDEVQNMFRQISQDNEGDDQKIGTRVKLESISEDHDPILSQSLQTDITILEPIIINGKDENSEIEVTTSNNKAKWQDSVTGEEIVLKPTTTIDEKKYDDTNDTNEDEGASEPQKDNESSITTPIVNTKSKVESAIHDLCEILKEHLSTEDLDTVMKKIQPLLNEINEEYKLVWSKTNVTAPPSSVPSVSGPPPPAPPPPPPPAPMVPKFKIKSKGATLTARECPENGGISDIEIRIQKKPKKDDMMSQLQKRLQDRRKRDSLAMKLSKLQ